MPDDVLHLSRFAPAALAGRRAARRLDAILADPDPAARVAALPVQDLFFLIQERGLADTQEIVALAEPEQFQGFLDLGGWSADSISDAAVIPWLQALIEAGAQKLTEVWRGLDQELTALLFQRWVRVYNLAEVEVPDWEEPPFVPTPDRFFMLKVITDSPDAARLVEQIVDGLYRVDGELARHTIRAAETEPTAELEEMARRWRSGRMQDLGYAEYTEALEVYRPIDVASVKVGEASADQPTTAAQLPVLLADPTFRQPFLARVLGRVSQAAEAQRLEAAMLTLLNRVLAANHIEPSDTAGIAQAAAAGAATLSLGLETVARGDELRGEEALRTIALVRLHRVGNSVVAKLVELANVLMPRAARAEEPYLSVLAALRRPRPELARALDDPPGIGSRPFAAVADVRSAARALGIVAAQVTLVREVLDVDPAALGARPTLGDVARTAMVRAVLDAPADAGKPLAAADVRRFAAMLEGGRIAERGRAAIDAAFARMMAEKKIVAPQEYDQVVSGWIGDLERDLGNLDTSVDPETRFVGGVLLE